QLGQYALRWGGGRQVLLALRLVSESNPLYRAVARAISGGSRRLSESRRLATRRIQDQPLSLRLRDCLHRRRLLRTETSAFIAPLFALDALPIPARRCRLAAEHRRITSHDRPRLARTAVEKAA